jgi:CRP/FNR family transcriptional regulator, cyclic AMP receptor protein
MDTNKIPAFKDSCSHCESAAGNSFCNIRSTELSDLTKIRFRRSYAAGSTLFAQGQRATGAFILCSGRVKLSSCSADGRVVTFGFAGRGEIVGLSPVLVGAEYETTAEAVEDCKINFLDRDELLAFLRTHPEACLNAAIQLGHDYQAAFKRICSLASSDTVANKLARIFLDWAGTARYATHPIRLQDGLTHEALAEMIGVSRETVTRALKQLRESKVATLKGHDLVIHSPDRLMAFARIVPEARGNRSGL